MLTYLSIKIKLVDPWMRFCGKTACQSKNNQILLFDSQNHSFLQWADKVVTTTRWDSEFPKNQQW